MSLFSLVEPQPHDEQLYFLLASRCVKIETKTAAYDTTEEAYVYVFVTKTIST